MPSPVDVVPRHNVINSRFESAVATLHVMCRGTKFIISLQCQDIEAIPSQERFGRLMAALAPEQDDTDEDYDEVCDWMLEPCFTLFDDLAPVPSHDRRLTIHDFYSPPTYHVSLYIREIHTSATVMEGPTITTDQAMMLPLEQVYGADQCASIRASELAIVAGGQEEDVWCELPRKAILGTERTTSFFFKPALDASQFMREVQIMGMVRAAAFEPQLRTSMLRFLVLSEDGSMILGALFDWITSIGDLSSVKKALQIAHLDVWERQVRATVQELHKHDIIWGDVHPGNVVIDAQMQAWVVDFGGGWVEPFVTRELSGTKQGDLLGIERVFAHLRIESDDADYEPPAKVVQIASRHEVEK